MTNTWQIKKLEDICKIFNGLWKGKTPPYVEVGVIRNTNFTKQGFLDDSDIAYIPVEEKQYEKRKLEYGDIILEKSGGGPNQPVGRVIIFDKEEGEFSFSNFTSAIRICDKDELDPHFLHRFLYFMYQSGATESMQRRSTGIRNLQLSEYKQISVPIPSLSEQKRLVSLLDDFFKKLEKAKENAAKNLNNAKELFEAYFEDLFSKAKDDWEERSFGDKELLQIVDGDRGKNYPKKSDFLEDGYCLFMNTKNVRQNGFAFNQTMFITKQKDEALGKGRLERGDVVLTTRGTIGNIGFYSSDVPYNVIRINSGMLIFRTNKDLLLPEYLFELLRSGFVKSQIEKHVSGAAQPQLPIKTLVNFRLPLPKSLSQQREIVEKIRLFNLETKKLEKIYEKKVANFDELKQSILNQAFTGRL